MSIAVQTTVSRKKRRLADKDEMPAKKRKAERTDQQLAQLALEQSADENEDVPVLSHKEKRKRKQEEAGRLPARAVSKSARSAFGVWIGNLAFATTEEKLSSFLTEGGCSTPTRFNMPRGRQSHEKNRGFAYVDFAGEDAAKAAVSLSEQHLDGRKLLIKLNNDFEGRPASSLTVQSLSKSAKRIADRQKNQPAPTLFIGNLGFEVDEARLRNMLEGNHLAALRWMPKAKLVEMQGEEGGSSDDEAEGKAKAKARSSVGIRKIRLGTFEDSGKCKGWAFIDFRSIQEATTALLNPQNHRLANRDLVVEYATFDAVRRGGGSVPRKEGVTFRKDPLGKEGVARSLRPRHGVEETSEKVVEEPTVEKAVPRPPKGAPSRRKPTPGAVLAKAQRAKVSIVESRGTKTVF